MKKKVAYVLASLVLLGVFSSASAQIIECRGKTITATVDALQGEQKILFVVKKGESIEDNDKVLAVRQGIGNESGKAVISFNIPETKNGETTDGYYDAYIQDKNGAVIKESFIYSSPENKMMAISALRDNDIILELKNVQYTNPFKALGIDVDSYINIVCNLHKEAEVLNLFNGAIENKNLASDDELVKAVKMSVSVAAINNDIEVKEHLKWSQVSFESVTFDKIADEKLVEWIVTSIKNNKKYSDIKSFEKAYNISNVLYLINNARFSELEEKFATYANMLEINSNSVYLKYVGLLSKTTVNEKIVNALKNKSATTVNELLNVIDTAIGNPNPSPGNANNGSSGDSPGVLPTITYAAISNAQNDIGMKKFADLADVQWANEEIEALAKKGIVNGDENGNFRPHDLVKREEFVKMLVCALQLHDKSATSSFEDVQPDKWFYSYVSSAYQNKIISGISDTMFGTGEIITRQDMAVMCLRAVGKDNIIVNDSNILFADEELISDYAKEAVMHLAGAGIVQGVGNNSFNPNDGATRAQAAVIIYRLFNL